MEPQRLIGRVRLGPDPKTSKGLENIIRTYYYTPEELHNVLVPALCKLEWVDGLEIQFADGREYHLEAAGPPPSEILQVCQDLKDQGFRLSLHLSKYMLDLFKPDAKTDEPIIDPNEFVSEFNFNPIVGHFREHEDIYNLCIKTESYMISGVQLNEEFARRITLESGFRADNKISELAKELHRKRPSGEHVCLDIGHFGRSLKEDSDDPRVVGQDHERCYAISLRQLHDTEYKEIPYLKARLGELATKTSASEKESRHAKLKLDRVMGALRIAENTLRFYDDRERVGGSVFYFNTSRIRECGDRIRQAHIHWLAFMPDKNKWYDHYPLLYRGRGPTPLQHRILTRIIGEGNLKSYTIEHRKEFNTVEWIDRTADIFENQFLR